MGITQSLTPISALNLGLSHTKQSGFLATSFNSVLVANRLEIETTPEKRTRDALSIRYKHAFDSRSSSQLGYSYYWDDWGIRASTIELRYYFRPQDGNVLWEPSYRYYTQTPADFFALVFDTSQTYQTSDSDLGRFHSHSYGIRVSWIADSLFSSKASDFDVGANYMRRSDGLDIYWLTLGWSKRL